MRKMILILLLFGCATKPSLLDVKSRALRAGYTADLQALADAARDARVLAVRDPANAALAHYWAGYALWQRAVNDVNRKVDPAADRAAALVEFDAAIAARERFADAHAIAAWLQGWLYSADPDNKDAHQKAMLAHLSRARELEPDNPRVLWELAYVLQLRDNTRARTMLDELVKRPDTAAPRSLEPDWGLPEALMLQAYNRANMDPTDIAVAERAARRALELRPGWYYVESILLPQIETKKR
jgi:hypothetical protein